jgi:NRPS condensation-like uncharacterized protein
VRMRKLGANERITWSYQQIRPMHFVIAAKIIGKITIEEMQNALEKAQQRHPLLNVGVVTVDGSETPWFKKDLAQIPLRIIKRINTEQWEQVVEEELENPFNPCEAPLVRVSLVSGENIYELVITCDHTIADGKSSLFLLRDILQYVGDPDQTIIPLPQKDSYEKILFGQRSSDGIPGDPGILEGKTRPKLPENSQPNLCAWLLSEIETAAIINRCKKEGVTVHAGICAAFLLSIAESQPTKKILKCLTPVNIRAALPGIDDDFGYYFTTVNTEHTVTPSLSIWDLSRSVSSQIKEAKIFAHLPELETFLSVSPDHEEAVNMMDFVNGHDIVVTNLGRLNIPEKYGQLELMAIYGLSLMTHIDRDLILGVMTFRDRMSLTITYSESFFTKSEIRQIQETAMNLLSAASSHKSLAS